MAEIPTNSLQTASDEELILRRNQVLQESQNPKLSAWRQAGMYIPSLAAGVVGFLGMNRLGKYLKETNKITSTGGKIAFGAGSFVVSAVATLATFGVILTKSIRAHVAESGEKFTEVNGEIGRRIGKTVDEVGFEPITAADMQRMKEAHQSGAVVGPHTQRAAQAQSASAPAAAMNAQ